MNVKNGPVATNPGLPPAPDVSPHASSHSSIGTDPLSPASIGAETPAGAQSKADTAAAAIAPFVHTQASAATPWIINHNLGRHVDVTVLDAGANAVLCHVENTTINQARAYPINAMAGKALCF